MPKPNFIKIHTNLIVVQTRVLCYEGRVLMLTVEYEGVCWASDFGDFLVAEIGIGRGFSGALSMVE